MAILKEAIANGQVQYLNKILHTNVLDEFDNLRSIETNKNTDEKGRDIDGENK